MFPAPRKPHPLLRAIGVAVEFATLGEVRLDPAWEEPAWLDDEGLRQEWFREAAPPAAVLPRAARASATFRPATAAGRRAWEQVERASRPAACSGARGVRALRDPSHVLRRRERPGTPPVPEQPCLWADGVRV
jgi:hypothetical protein